jgi:type VI secretion system secreted protein VgrG
MAVFAQNQRFLNLTSSLGPDVLLATGFSGREQISSLFHFQLDLLSERDDIAPAEIVGQPVTWSVCNVHSEPRFFNGYVSGFAAGGKSGRGLRSYRAEVVPWLWFLTRTTDCRIFQNKSVDQIIQTIFDDLAFSDYSFFCRVPITSASIACNTGRRLSPSSRA